MSSNIPLIRSESSFSEDPLAGEPDALGTCADTVAQLACDALSDSLGGLRKSLKLAALHWEQDAEHVHQVRVSGRRAMAAIRLFSDVIPSTHEKWFRKKLKSILDAARPARDLDVLIHDQLPNCGRAAGKLERVWRKQREKSQKDIVGIYRKMERKDRLRKHIDSLVSDLEQSSVAGILENQQPRDDWAKSRILDMSRQFFAAIPGKASDHSLHQLRILCKRIRYMIVFLQPVLNSHEIGAVATCLAELQKQLGSLQDHVAARDHFQRSLKHLRRPRHRKTVLRMIDNENEIITERVSGFQLRSNPDECQPLKSCIDAILSLMADAEAGSA